MISRRLIRIKILKILFAYMFLEQTVENAEKELLFSINKTYELYHHLLLLPIDIADYAAQRIEARRQKNYPTGNDSGLDAKLANNAFVQLLREHKELQAFKANNKFEWPPDVIRKIYRSLQSEPCYAQYAGSGQHSFAEDKILITEMLEREIEDNENLYSALEDQSIYWTDDIEFALSHTIKTCRFFTANGGRNNTLLAQYKDAADKEFAERLLCSAIVQNAEYRRIIDSNTNNWDLERISLMDVVIMLAAVAELTTFAGIPVNVTLNEYIEIAKYYSTPQSSVFINGVLDKMSNELIRQQRIVKRGEGLIGRKPNAA